MARKKFVTLLLLLLLSCFSRVQFCATPQMAAHQAPPSLGFSRQEHWSGLPFPSPMNESGKWKWSRSVMSDSSRPRGLQPTRLLRPWDKWLQIKSEENLKSNDLGICCELICAVPLSPFICYSLSLQYDYMVEVMTSWLNDIMGEGKGVNRALIHQYFLIRNTRELTPSLFTLWRHSKKAAICKPGSSLIKVHHNLTMLAFWSQASCLQYH